MDIQKSGARYSAIVGIGEKIKQKSKETNSEYLLLNRGVNSVCNIDLNSIVSDIDFNTVEMQVYPPSQGRPELRNSINEHYFNKESKIENILICGGGMSALDLVFQSIKVKQILLPEYYWGSYAQIMTIRGIESNTYAKLEDLEERTESLKNSAVIICDPNNPLGNKLPDEKILQHIHHLNDNGTIVIVDCPYRRIFCGEEDDFFQQLVDCENVIIVESFSKSLGLSGQRLGFIHTPHKDLTEELGIRLMYATNGINAFSQILVHSLLSTEKGKQATLDFKTSTVAGIRKNIEFLKSKHLLAEKFYQDSEPVGIFAVVNQSEEKLLEHRIGSVSLSYFTRNKKESAQKFARICVSVPHDKFRTYFNQF
ncbi:pyridoxal phosphate-dependent aminotransferase [Ancylomarina longa]|uniref:Aminotransferase n=1 Tax=Ancylomarina longa TaxID=2487017 RepID=A0A434AVW3_9BACT|nr:pyridoxal phosphate-dependent aminotransferase [Ancylomarina longa]RUT78516.1 pyridoxal phosphate-dependent aminotransferase [Ancylomarina longa]